MSMSNSASQARRLRTAQELLFTINRLKEVHHPSAAVAEKLGMYQRDYNKMLRFDVPVRSSYQL